MSSIIAGYNYDIFISYRQKDNKHDGWVTEFVNNLKGELESTFKEDVSVYFDINPHDGLLETYDVDASLKEKLKCLIFIPVISRTYCDPKSFAWEHELKAFVEMASKDQFGLKVKLANGNVASRVIPVLIHDLDHEDKSCLEEELGGHIRGIEFIYREPGVNKPLPKTDPKYSIQVNKAANTIRELYTGLKTPFDNIEQNLRFSDKKVKNSGKKITKVLIGIILGIIVITAGYFLFNLFEKEPEKSIAVLPFKLLSDEPEKQYLADGMMDAITLHLSKIKDLRVLGRTSTEQYLSLVRTTSQIGQELNVSYVLEGSFQKFGDSVRLIIQLVKTGKEGHLWANNYDRLWKNVFSVQSEVAQSIANELKAIITPEERSIIEKVPTSSLTAYDLYQRGQQELWKFRKDENNKQALMDAQHQYKYALGFDSTFSLAYIGLANVFWYKNYWREFYSDTFMDSAMILVDQALLYDPELSEAFEFKGRYYYIAGKYNEAIYSLNKALRLNPNNWSSYPILGDIYQNSDLIKSIESYEKAILLNKEPNSLPSLLRSLANCYWNAGFNEKCYSYMLDALKVDGDSVTFYNEMMAREFYDLNFRGSLIYANKAYALDSNNRETLEYLSDINLMLGNTNEASFFITKFLDRIKNLGVLRINNMHRIAYTYWLLGKKEEADHFFQLQIDYCNQDIKLNRPNATEKFSYYDLAGINSFRGEINKAYENLKTFNQRKIMPYIMVQIFKWDPLFDNIRNESEFQEILKDVQAKYQTEHERVRKWLEENKKLY